MEIQPLYTSIANIIEVKAGTIVMENHNGFPVKESNLYLVSPSGEILWQAEKPDITTLFTKVKLNEDATLSTFTSRGQFCDINTSNGKIINSSSFR